MNPGLQITSDTLSSKISTELLEDCPYYEVFDCIRVIFLMEVI